MVSDRSLAVSGFQQNFWTIRMTQCKTIHDFGRSGRSLWISWQGMSGVSKNIDQCMGFLCNLCKRTRGFSCNKVLNLSQEIPVVHTIWVLGRCCVLGLMMHPLASVVVCFKHIWDAHWPIAAWKLGEVHVNTPQFDFKNHSQTRSAQGHDPTTIIGLFPVVRGNPNKYEATISSTQSVEHG